MSDTSRSGRNRILVAAGVMVVVGIASVWLYEWSRPDQWTVMLYIDGDNNLSTSAQSSFDELVKIGSSTAVHITALLDKDGPNDTRAYDIGGLNPSMRAGICLDDMCEREMGDQATLESFIRWSQRLHPAQNYVLILWDHGQGFQLAGGRKARQSSDICEPGRTYSGPPMKSMCQDNNPPTGKILFNAFIMRAIARASKKKLAVLGMDACLMQMLETGYEVRDASDVLVASEADETGFGWSYGWVRLLKAMPWISSSTVGKAIVNWYRLKYEHCSGSAKENRTLSAIKTNGIPAVAVAVDALADSLLARIHTEDGFITVLGARAHCHEFGPRAGAVPEFSHVDLGRFCEVIRRTGGVEREAEAVSASVRDVVIAKYGDRNIEGDDFGSTGLAVFFPVTWDSYQRESEGAYDPDKPSYPGVKFVHEHRWSRFVKAFAGHVCKSNQNGGH